MCTPVKSLLVIISMQCDIDYSVIWDISKIVGWLNLFNDILSKFSSVQNCIYAGNVCVVSKRRKPHRLHEQSDVNGF